MLKIRLIKKIKKMLFVAQTHKKHAIFHVDIHSKRIPARVSLQALNLQRYKFLFEWRCFTPE